MNIILTHEQADFDALASLLGAYLLDEESIPVMPRRMNRNVRAFLTLYGADLPFVDPRDLPPEPVERVTLVDTQSLVSVKGMSAGTKVHVVDHHPLREDLPVDWSITVSGTGANTTLFIESLRDRPLALNTIQATLLLLGIYEDTGSLTYTRTTSRDLRAASFLLDQGASLRIATDFINHPLSKGQQRLYDALRASAEIHTVHGHAVILACGDAGNMDEELSTIVHKLRDLLDPDALVVLVTIRGGVQLIARSTSDNIDVAEIAAHFGGGGHDRAAAGLIKDREMKDIYQEIISLLQEHVRPAITVAQIMSSGPQTLSIDTPVDEAARRMQRYGYEGYPVVKGERLVGLLTRRSVDRALAHRLNLTAGSLMEAGEHTVQPGDSIELLQHLMTETGWGQIPVVHPESGRIIGIVTRTDLLKTFAPSEKAPIPRDLSSQLERALAPARLELLKLIARTAHEQHDALYIVGGFVRDLLLDRPSQDFDLVVEGDAINLARALSRRYGGRVTTHHRFGTAKWSLRRENGIFASPEAQPINFSSPDLPETVDLITARTEFYTHPTALPTVERGSIKLDLHRRDFTINTLALRLDGIHYGELHDYWGGYSDLRHGRVRVLHSLSFVDDPTRMLRAIRFEQRFGFTIEIRTLELLREALTLLDRVSGDRVRHELDHVLLEDRVIPMLVRLRELGLLRAIHPGLVWDDWLRGRFDALLEASPGPEWGLDTGENRQISTTESRLPTADGQAQVNSDFPINAGTMSANGRGLLSAKTRLELMYLLWLLRLNPGQANDVAARLKLSASLVKKVQAACALWRESSSLAMATPSQAVGQLDEIPPEVLYAVYLAYAGSPAQSVIYKYITRWQNIHPLTTGLDLKARGLPPGPAYRRILDSLREAWLEGEISTPEEEAQYLDKLLAEAGPYP